MARRNLLRSLLAASLMSVPFAATLLAAPAPAGSAEEREQNEVHWIRLSEKSGFNPGVIDVRVGDFIAFNLDDESASPVHSVTFDDQSACPGAPGGVCWPELRFNDDKQACTWRGVVLPNTRCAEVRRAGPVRYFDRLGRENGGPEFQGLIRVAGVPPTTTTTAPPSTTTTTAAPATTTTTRPGSTTTTLPPTTNTTAPTTIRPFVISDSTTTTTAAPAAAASGADTAGSGKNGGGTGAGAKEKDKGKGKAADPSTTSTTVAPAPEIPEINLTFEPVTLPESVVASSDGADGAGIEEAAVMDLLDTEEDAAADDDNRYVVLALGSAGLLVLGIGLIAWFSRSSRYFPA